MHRDYHRNFKIADETSKTLTKEVTRDDVASNPVTHGSPRRTQAHSYSRCERGERMNPRIKTLGRWARARATATGNGQDGVVTAFTLVLLAALIVLAGLVFDGGMALSGRVRALDEAQEAARAGAQKIDVAAFRAGGQAVLAPGQATAAADAYLATTGDTGTVTVAGNAVTVTVTRISRTQILSALGIGSFIEHATATATAEQGR
jgi:hypothetical protein